ncbi:MAG: flagellar hook protein FlgE [Phycisphaerales bacterium]
MASTTAMTIGLSGLNANARNLDVIGNNIANINTTAFKSSRMLFATQFSRTLSLGSVPGATSGGSNPTQIGLGVSIAGTQRNFNSGALSATGDSRDLALEGDGFFIVERGANRFYTRAGAFRPNSQNDLVNISGDRVMGYGVDANFVVNTASLMPLNLPVGQMRLTQATANAAVAGNLNAGGTVAGQGATITAGALTSIAVPGPITGATLLTDIDDPNQAGTQPLFTAGQQIQITGAQQGGKTLPTQTLAITATTTAADVQAFLQSALGINTGVGTNADGAMPGVTITAGGQFQIIGNQGTANDLTVATTNIRTLSAAGAPVGSPLTMTKAPGASATGESVRATLIAYDSLGNPLSVDVTMVLEQRSGGAGTTWRWFAESADNLTGTGSNLIVGSGTLSFDPQGQLITTAPVTLTVGRTGTGAIDPMSFDVDVSTLTALTDSTPNFSQTSQDGAPMGILASFSVSDNGMITGAFTNGLTRTIGQVAVAKFTNPEGLVDVGSNLFGVGPNSGTPIVTTPTSFGTGRVVGGSLELSNVDLAEQFTNLITASTGYSASSRVITTADQLIQQLLVIGR